MGVVGEIYAYHFLREKFGHDAVTLDAWVSEIRLEVQPPVAGELNDASDDCGFDFRFSHRDKRWHVEVKATMGDDQQFDLGISEIKAANSLAQAQDKPWRILRVRNALGQPEFDWLPNPFGEGSKKYFHAAYNRIWLLRRFASATEHIMIVHSLRLLGLLLKVLKSAFSFCFE